MRGMGQDLSGILQEKVAHEEIEVCSFNKDLLSVLCQHVRFSETPLSTADTGSTVLDLQFQGG